jgi:hypothetical protein
MLTVINPRAEPTLRDWAHANRMLLLGHILWAVTMITLAALGQPSDLVDCYTISALQGGLL